MPTITSLWKDKATEVLQTIYHGHLDDNVLDSFLQKKVNESLQTKRVAQLRNIYENTVFSIDLDQIYNYVKKRNLNVGANAGFTVSGQEQLSDVSNYLTMSLDGRKAEKNLAKKFESEGKLKEAALHDTLQTKRKQDINSCYGIMAQYGSFFFSIDSASYITCNARQLTAEMTWAFEKFLTGNTCLKSYNEALLYYNNLLQLDRHFNVWGKYISYVPSKTEVQNHILKQLTDIPDYFKITHKIEKSLFWWLSNLTEKDRIYLYYKNNLSALLQKNPKVMNIFKEMLSKDEIFLNPYSIPEVYKPSIDLLIEICKEFVIAPFTTYDRLHKYGDPKDPTAKGEKRDAIILSDTDSSFVSVSNIKEIIIASCKGHINPLNSEDEVSFKVVNSLAAIISAYIKIMLDNMLKQSNTVPPFEKYPFDMKNEYYYKKLAVYTGIKKNYAGYMLLREGNLVPPKKQIAFTGIKLTSSRIPEKIREAQNALIEKYILKSDYIDSIGILNEIKRIENMVIDGLKAGEKEWGIPQRFSGSENYKSSKQEVELDGQKFEINNISIQAYRLAELWNRIYLDDPILAGDKMLTFETRIRREEDLEFIKDISMRETLKKVVYSDRWDGDYNILKKSGLSTIGIPADGDTYKIPSWLLDIIDYKEMAKKHLQTLTDFLPSIGLTRTRINSNDFRYSSLVSF